MTTSGLYGTVVGNHDDDIGAAVDRTRRRGQVGPSGPARRRLAARAVPQADHRRRLTRCRDRTGRPRRRPAGSAELSKALPVLRGTSAVVGHTGPRLRQPRGRFTLARPRPGATGRPRRAWPRVPRTSRRSFPVAPPAGTLRVGRYFLALVAILAVLYGLVFWPGQSHTPKLGLDLEGGTQVIFKAQTPNGKAPSKSSMNEARRSWRTGSTATAWPTPRSLSQGNDQIADLGARQGLERRRQTRRRRGPELPAVCIMAAGADRRLGAPPRPVGDAPSATATASASYVGHDGRQPRPRRRAAATRPRDLKHEPLTAADPVDARRRTADRPRPAPARRRPPTASGSATPTGHHDVRRRRPRRRRPALANARLRGADHRGRVRQADDDAAVQLCSRAGRLRLQRQAAGRRQGPATTSPATTRRQDASRLPARHR